MCVFLVKFSQWLTSHLPATSQLYSQAPKSDLDQLPVTPDGGILNIHLTSFVSAIDNLLTAGRSQSPRRVLSPVVAVVNAVSAIIGDLSSYERKRGRADMDSNVLHDLQERAEATLSNLVATANTHATSMGMAPISLLDAAASHLSAAVTEIGKVVFVRKASKVEQDRFYSLSGSTSGISEGISTSSPPNHGRIDSSLRLEMQVPVSKSSTSTLLTERNYPNNGAQPETAEDAWMELKASQPPVINIMILTRDPSHILKLNQNQSSMPYKVSCPVSGAKIHHRHWQKT